MIAALAACLVFQQTKPLTTPIVPAPKPAAKRAPAKKPKPVVKVPIQPPPFVPVFEDKPAGSGPPAKAGDLVTIQFLVRGKMGDIADSKRRGLPYRFRIGEPGNDPLLELVVKGMKVGGTRTGSVPAKEAYGAAGVPPLIKPQDMLQVTVTLLSRGGG